MKNFPPKIWNQIGLSLTALSAMVLATSQSAVAATFNVAGYTWDSANSVQSGSIVGGSESIFGFNASFLGDKPEVASQTVGSILGFNPGFSTSVNLGNQVDRSIIELNWGEGMGLTNAAGNDLVLYENGSWLAPEAFAVAVRKAGEKSFTEFRYEFSDGFAFEADVFATGFDLTDFGLGANEAIDAIRITNLLATDKVSGSDGQGFLGGNYDPLTGSSGTGKYETSRFDPDITYVVGLHKPTKPIPEPTSTLGLLMFGLFGAGTVLKRKQQQKV